MIDLKIYEQSDALLMVMNDASSKLRDFCIKHDTSQDDHRETAVELQRAVYAAHAKWLKFVEENFVNWGG
ncbi:hypothetical protein [Pseudomonas sp. PS01298]|uniref:hypothetical protein n=1 Tax=Pseudomonas sp. PS01298 TaxID=2991434 RepID=UPI00249BEEC9|nr:hypothetical protein [Pseudomonas sp. PS01298]